MTDEERTPKANSKAHGHRTATLDDAAGKEGPAIK